jgi:hypothetical protein
VIGPLFQGAIAVPGGAGPELDRIGRMLREELAETPTVSTCLHLLRVEGQGARFRRSDPEGEVEVLSLLTDAERGRSLFGGPMLVRTSCGVRYPTLDSTITGRKAWRETHRDQCLAAFGETGVSLTRVIRFGDGEARLRDVLRDSIAGFHLKQEELVWTALAYALYLPPRTSWTNRFGESTDFDQLTEVLMEAAFEKSSCGGVHLISTLTAIWRVDEEVSILSGQTREKLRSAVRGYVDRAVATQSDDGSWPLNWLASGASRVDDESSRLLATGHIAEWLLCVPPDVAVPRETLERSAIYLTRRLQAADQTTIRDDYCPVSHAVCVLQQLLKADGRGDVERAERARPKR